MFLARFHFYRKAFRTCDSLRFYSTAKLAKMEGDAKNTVCFARLNENAQLPVYSSEGAAGMDVFSCESATIPAKGKGLVSTGLKMSIPSGYYARVAPRSGLAVKNFIDTGAGVIDEDYRGEVKVLLFNFGETEFNVKAGERIAQLLIEKVLHANIVEVSVEKLTKTVRGSGGFGSTGV